MKKTLLVVFILTGMSSQLYAHPPGGWGRGWGGNGRGNEPPMVLVRPRFYQQPAPMVLVRPRFYQQPAPTVLVPVVPVVPMVTETVTFTWTFGGGW